MTHHDERAQPTPTSAARSVTRDPDLPNTAVVKRLPGAAKQARPPKRLKRAKSRAERLDVPKATPAPPSSRSVLSQLGAKERARLRRHAASLMNEVQRLPPPPAERTQSLRDVPEVAALLQRLLDQLQASQHRLERACTMIGDLKTAHAHADAQRVLAETTSRQLVDHLRTLRQERDRLRVRCEALQAERDALSDRVEHLTEAHHTTARTLDALQTHNDRTHTQARELADHVHRVATSSLAWPVRTRLQDALRTLGPEGLALSLKER